jgi:hypothetical protein
MNSLFGFGIIWRNPTNNLNQKGQSRLELCAMLGRSRNQKLPQFRRKAKHERPNPLPDWYFRTNIVCRMPDLPAGTVTL